MRWLRQLRKCTPLEARMVVEATLLMVGVRFALLVLPFRLVAGRILGGGGRAPGPSPVGAVTRGMVAWAVRKANELLPGRCTCLQNAFVAYVLLTRAGFAPVLKIGVQRADSGEFRAHAWVEERGSVVVGGARSDTDRYSALEGFEELTAGLTAKG